MKVARITILYCLASIFVLTAVSSGRGEAPKIFDSSLLFLKNTQPDQRAKIAGRFADDRTVEVSIRFKTKPLEGLLLDLESAGIRFYRLNGKIASIGRIYGATVPWSKIDMLQLRPEIEKVESCWKPKVVPLLNVSRPLVQADSVWNRSTDPQPLIGKGIVVADFDLGVDVFHPAFWYSDGDTLDWIDSNNNAIFDSGDDGVDLNHNGKLDPGETLRFIDGVVNDTANPKQLSNQIGRFEADFDWLYVDSNNNGKRDFGYAEGFSDNDPTLGEQIFAVDDRNHSNSLDVGEKIIALKTSKVKATLEKNMIERRRNDGMIFDRGDSKNHGTSVCGIIAGEFPGRKLTGIAPGAELLVANTDDLPPEIYIPWALYAGADVMAYEFGSWISEFMDGSSNMEEMISSLAKEGVVQVTASGNLAGPTRKKHARFAVQPSDSVKVKINVPGNIGIKKVFISILWRNSSDSLIFKLIDPLGNSVHLPGGGNTQDFDNYSIFSNRDTSPRGTGKMDVTILYKKTIGNVWIFFALNPFGMLTDTVNAYVSDDVTVWVNGAQFIDFVTDDGTVTWPATSDSSIVVGAYDPRGTRNPVGSLSDFSGWGRRIDGKLLVDITAPGYTVYAPGSHYKKDIPFGGYVTFEGTSAALPFGAGAVALLLEAEPSFRHGDVERILKESAISDQYTGAVPNDKWGYGKLKINDALSRTTFSGKLPPSITKTTLLEDTEDATGPYTITTSVTPSQNLRKVSLFFSSDSLNFREIEMTSIGDGRFQAGIPGMKQGTRVSYYIQAESKSALVGTEPPGAPARAFRFNVKEREVLLREITDTGPATAGAALSAAWGDYNNDGAPDLYVIRNGQPNLLYRNNGDGTFSEIAKIAKVDSVGPNVGAAWGDYDNDGKIDLYVISSIQNNLLFHNNGDGTFTEVGKEAGVNSAGGFLNASWIDYENDGWLDLFVVRSGLRSLLYKNNKDGTFSEVGLQTGLIALGQTSSAAWGDYDNDGYPDLFVVRYGESNIIFHNNRDGTFSELSAKLKVNVTGRSKTAIWGDYNGDGNLDLYIVRDSEPNLLYRNNGDGTFTEIGWDAGVAIIGPGQAAAFEDFDNDGDLDLYVSCDGQPGILYANIGRGVFVNVTRDSGLRRSGKEVGASPADYDWNGFVDLYIVDQSSPNRLYKNLGGKNHWLEVELRGTKNNSQGIGAWISITSKKLSQTRYVGGTLTSGPQSNLPVHFGLGDQEQIDALEITWPKGQKQIVNRIIADQRISIPEDVAVNHFVWPGDTDGDGQVQASDLEPLVRYWKQSGAPRVRGDLSWIGQGTVRWAGVNADTNGDGIVDEKDLEGLVQNWHKKRTETMEKMITVENAYREIFESLLLLPDSEPKKAMKSYLEARIGIVEKPLRFHLEQNSPNPFSEVTVFRFTLPKTDSTNTKLHVSMVVYDLLGQPIRKLFSNAIPVGEYSIIWDGKDEKGKDVASGLYICRLEMKGQSQSIKLLRLR